MALTAYIDISRYKDWKFIWGYPEGKLYYGLIIGANGFRLIINTIGQTQKLKTGELVFMIRRDFMKWVDTTTSLHKCKVLSYLSLKCEQKIISGCLN